LATIAQLTRPEMATAGRNIVILLQSRQSAGPPEPALDAYIPELEPVVTGLEQGVSGQVLAASALKALLARVELADNDVDTRLRHHFYYINVEATQRSGPNILGAQALEAAAFPDGLAHVNDYIPDENRLCRDALAALRSPEHAATVAAIELPAGWLDKWEKALNESDAAFDAVQKTRASKSIHVLTGQDAEVAFVDVMLRLRRYIDSRASRTDKVKLAQGRLLLAPLLEVLNKARAEERARETRREHAKKKGDKPAAAETAAAAVSGAGSSETKVEPAAEGGES